MSVKLHSVCKITQCVCVKLHTVCEITQRAQNYTYSIGKNSFQLKNFTLTPWAPWATHISCDNEVTPLITMKVSKDCHKSVVVGMPDVLTVSELKTVHEIFSVEN